MELTPATRANMLAHPGCVCFSFETNEEYSGDHNDWFMMGPNEVLKDDQGNPMWLMERIVSMRDPRSGTVVRID